MQNRCICKSIRHSLRILFFFGLICFNVQKTVLVTLVCHGWGRWFVHMQISGAQAVRPDFTAHRPSSYMLFPMMKCILPKHGSFSSSWYVSQEGSAQCNRDIPTGHQKTGWILIPGFGLLCVHLCGGLLTFLTSSQHVSKIEGQDNISGFQTMLPEPQLGLGGRASIDLNLLGSGTPSVLGLK